MTERENHTELDLEILAKVRPFLGREITPALCEQLLTAMLSVGRPRYPSHQSVDLTSIVAKAMADSIGHGMREKCLERAKAVILALDELQPPSALATAIEYVRWVMINLPIDFQMRDECPTDMLMHVLGFLQGLYLPPSSHLSGEPVRLIYTNWRGETSERIIKPMYVWFGSTEWHPEPQWLLTAFDLEKNADRDFALKDFGQPLAPQPREVV